MNIFRRFSVLVALSMLMTPILSWAALTPIDKSIRAGFAGYTQDSGGKLVTLTAEYRAPFFTLFGVPVGFEGGIVALKDTGGSIQPAFDLGLAPSFGFGSDNQGMHVEANLGIISVPFAGDDTDVIGRITQTATFLGGAFRMNSPKTTLPGLSVVDGIVVTYRRLMAADGWNEFRISLEVKL